MLVAGVYVENRGHPQMLFLGNHLLPETVSHHEPGLAGWAVQLSLPRTHLSLLPATEITKARKPSVLHGRRGSNSGPEASLAIT